MHIVSFISGHVTRIIYLGQRVATSCNFLQMLVSLIAESEMERYISLILRVLLVKQPDISEPTFLTQYQIVYNMKKYLSNKCAWYQNLKSWG